MVAAAIIGGVATVAGSAISANAASSAAHAQENAANNATNTQLAMFNQTRGDQAPWRQAGATALSSIGGGFGLGPSSGGVDSGFFSHQFGPEDLKSNLAPNYDFMLKQGQGATTAQANAMGGLGANSLKAINDYTQNYAQNAYQQAYTNYTANQTNIFNRLASIAGLGQTAGSNQTTGGSQYGAGIAGAQMGYGNAAAAGAIGVGNAVSGGIGSLGNYYLLSQLAGGGGGATSLGQLNQLGNMGPGTYG